MVDGDDGFVDFAQRVSAIIIAGVLAYMSYLSLRVDFQLTWPVIIGMLMLVTLLLYGPMAVASILEAWRGGGS